MIENGGSGLENNTLDCGHNQCGACCGGSCGGCGSHGGALELTQAEIDLLQLLAQTPFLPVVRQYGAEHPILLDDSVGSAEDLGTAATALYQKRLIELDYDLPLLNFDYAGYEESWHKGSVALTYRGQEVVELLEIQGIEA